MGMMKAVAITGSRDAGSPDSFEEISIPAPEPGEHDLLVRIRGVSVNPVDCKVRRGITRPDSPVILGWDASGTVERVGSAVTLFKPGDEVFYMGTIGAPGSYAEYGVVNERLAGRKPKNLDFVEAAAVPLTALTAWESLYDRLKINIDPERPKRLLVIGGAGGLGSAAVQIASKIPGVEVIATASRPETEAWVRKLGAEKVLNHRNNLAAELESCGIENVTHIFNANDNLPYWQVMSEIIAPQGAIVLHASTKAPLDLDLFMRKSVSIHWEFVSTRPTFLTEDMARQGEILHMVAERLERGEMLSALTERLPPLSPDSAAQAHAMIETGHMIGKLAMPAIGC